MKRIFLAFALSAALAAGACTQTAQVAGQIGQSLSSNTPQQVNTLADAINADTLANVAVSTYVNTGNPSMATLVELRRLLVAVHGALVDLERANAAKQSLTFAAFNAALSAFNSYATNAGVKH